MAGIGNKVTNNGIENGEITTFFPCEENIDGIPKCSCRSKMEDSIDYEVMKSRKTELAVLNPNRCPDPVNIHVRLLREMSEYWISGIKLFSKNHFDS